ncbi:MAG: hypothetical protein QM741_12750 [Rudaea sp.]|uniref:HAMP domain-containing protein n=1 Tax=Rudaea sp. TaxID=2136325 RepID=UPI0039E2996D
MILLLGVLGGVFYSLPAVRHIREIGRAARRIGDGDYTQRLPLGRRNTCARRSPGSARRSTALRSRSKTRRRTMLRSTMR